MIAFKIVILVTNYDTLYITIYLINQKIIFVVLTTKILY